MKKWEDRTNPCAEIMERLWLCLEPNKQPWLPNFCLVRPSLGGSRRITAIHPISITLA